MENNKHTPTIYRSQIEGIYDAISQAVDKWPLMNEQAIEIAMAVNLYGDLDKKYKALEKSHENLLDTLRKVARGSCLRQINTENKCICYPCISQNAISKAEGDL